jgi:hypothetical protein
LEDRSWKIEVGRKKKEERKLKIEKRKKKKEN